MTYYNLAGLQPHPLQNPLYERLHGNIYKEGERRPGNTRPIQEWEHTYVESVRLFSTLILPVAFLSNLANFSHRLRPQRLGIKSHGTPVPHRHIDTVPWGSSFELVRVHVLR